MPWQLAVTAMTQICAMVLVGTLLFSGAVLAADMPLKAPVAAPAPYIWTGFYVGAHVGGGWSDTDWRHGHCDCADMGAPGEFLTSANGNALLGGVQAGYNHQYAPNWLFGFEGQFSWTSIDGTGTWTHHSEPHTASFDVKWVATFGPRLGYVFDRGSVYIKGGVAFANIDYDHTHLLANSTLHAVSGSDTKTGWFIGGGIEHALGNQWSAKVEYNFIDLGSENVTLTGCCTVRFKVDQQIHIVKAGINYRFGAPAAVVARY